MVDHVFVNREEELERFRAGVELRSKPVLVICGGKGVGKSALRRNMAAVCSIRKVEIEWRSARAYSYQDIMQVVADEGIGEVADFAEFRERLAAIERARRIYINLETAGSIEIARRAEFQGVGSVTMAAVNIGRVDVGGRSDGLAVNDMVRLTDAFSRCLGAATGDDPVMIFLVNFELANQETKNWVWDELVPRLEDESLRHVRLTIFTSEILSLEASLRRLVDVLPLAPLKIPHIVEYMQQRGMVMATPLIATGLVNALEITGNVNMISIAAFVDTLLAGQKPASR